MFGDELFRRYARQTMRDEQLQRCRSSLSVLDKSLEKYMEENSRHNEITLISDLAKARMMIEIAGAIVGESAFSDAYGDLLCQLVKRDMKGTDNGE